MGLGGQKTAWQRQTKDFGHTKASKYSSLVFDNRGLGESDKPLMRYSTSEMARDIVELLDHVGWTAQRSVHVIGISMGGMIAQELVRCRYTPNKILIVYKLKANNPHPRASSSQRESPRSPSSPPLPA